MKETAIINSPIGLIGICAVGEKICNVSFVDHVPASSRNPRSKILQQTITELEEYFQGSRKEFDVAISLEYSDPTSFQLLAWNQLLKIPFGKTISYKDQAEKMDVKAFRAVGSANGKNPIAIIVPCHRVVSTDGSLGGYSSGLWRKKFLLNLESVIIPTK